MRAKNGSISRFTLWWISISWWRKSPQLLELRCLCPLCIQWARNYKFIWVLSLWVPKQLASAPLNKDHLCCNLSETHDTTSEALPKWHLVGWHGPSFAEMEFQIVSWLGRKRDTAPPPPQGRKSSARDCSSPESLLIPTNFHQTAQRTLEA